MKRKRLDGTINRQSESEIEIINSSETPTLISWVFVDPLLMSSSKDSPWPVGEFDAPLMY